MTVWPNVGQSLEDPWTEPEPSHTKPDSGTLTSKGALTLVPPKEEPFTSTLPEQDPGSLFVDALVAAPGLPPSKESESTTVVVSAATKKDLRNRNRPPRSQPCHRCQGRKEPGFKGWYCATCRPIALAERKQRDLMHANRLRRKPCKTCGGPKEARQIFDCKACMKSKNSGNMCNRCGEFPKRGKGMRLCEQCARPPKKPRITKKRVKDELPTLPAEPLARVIRRIIEESRCAFDIMPLVTGTTGRPMRDDLDHRVCQWLGIDSTTFRNWETGGRKTAKFDLADKVLIRTRWNWFDVWNGDEMCSNGKTVAEVFESTCVPLEEEVVA